MKTLVGLGNPGDKYKSNRHNVGHMFIDYLKTKNSELRTIKTDCFMNISGKFVSSCVTRYKLQVSRDLYIVHDDLDIPLSKYKIQFGTGPKLHNGILSIEEELGTSEFWRIRIGVDNPSTRFARSGQGKIDGETYSLQDFTSEELKQLQPVFEKIYKQILI